MAVIFYDALDSLNNDSKKQSAYVTTSPQSLPLVGSLQGGIKMISQLAGVISEIIANGTSLGLPANTLKPYFDIGRALFTILEKLSQIPAGSISFTPYLQIDRKDIGLARTFWNKHIYGLICVNFPQPKSARTATMQAYYGI